MLVGETELHVLHLYMKHKEGFCMSTEHHKQKCLTEQEQKTFAANTVSPFKQRGFQIDQT